MRTYWTHVAGGGIGSALVGLVLTLIGVVIWVFPDIIAYVIASLFVFAGVSMLIGSWQARRNISYRRLDDEFGPF